jgi:hypothetical protein
MMESFKEKESDKAQLQNIIDDPNTSKILIPTGPHLVLPELALRFCLTNHLSKAEKKNTWIPILSNFFVILIALITSSFNDFLVPKEMWKSIFIVSGIATFCLFIYTFIRYAKNPITIDKIIEDLEKDCIIIDHTKDHDQESEKNGN